MAYQCQSCYKLCAVEAEATVDSFDVTSDGEVNVTVSAVLNSQCCSDEVATGELDFAINVGSEHTCSEDEDGEGQWPEDFDEPEVIIEQVDEVVTLPGKTLKSGKQGKPRTKTYRVWKVTVKGNINCTVCSDSVDFTGSDEMQFEQAY